MRYFALSLLPCLFATGGLTAEDEFAPGIRIEAGDGPIDVGGFRGAAPCFGDFDGDGLNDLLVGQDERGRLRIYRNKGSKEKPRFDGFEWFRANGEIVELPVGGLFRPQLADLNGDGKQDVVTDSWSGVILWYRRKDQSEFAGAEVLKLANGQVLNAGTNAGFHVVDWDGDGDNDLIVSGQSDPDARVTEVRLVENQGVAPSLSLAPPTSLEADGLPIQTAGDVHPSVADWNGDGKLDLLLGLGDGGVLLYENRGERQTPRLARARQLVLSPVRGPQPPGKDAQHRGQGGSIWLTDWDQDGRLDILMGDSQREMVEPEASDSVEQLEKARQEAAQVLSDYRRLRRLDHRIDPEKRGKERELVRQARAKDARRLKELQEKIAKLEKALQPPQVLHGYVWLLRRMN